MSENMKVLLLSLTVMVFYFLSQIFILKVRMSDSDLPSYGRRTKTGAIDDITKRLHSVLEELNDSSQKDNEIASITGKKLNIKEKIKYALVTTLSESGITSDLIKALLIAFGANTAISSLTLKTYGPIIGVMLFMSLTLMILSTLNVIALRKNLKFQKDALTMMELNFLHYTNSPNFEESVKKTIDSLNPTLSTYKILSRFLDKVYGLNVPKAEAIRGIKTDFGGIPQLNQYFDIVVKAEDSDPSYKKSLAGIPDFYGMVITQKKDFTLAMTIVYGAYFVMGMALIGLTIKTAIENIAVAVPLITNPTSYKMMLGGFALYTMSGFIVYNSTSTKPERKWG